CISVSNTFRGKKYSSQYSNAWALSGYGVSFNKDTQPINSLCPSIRNITSSPSLPSLNILTHPYFIKYTPLGLLSFLYINSPFLKVLISKELFISLLKRLRSSAKSLLDMFLFSLIFISLFTTLSLNRLLQRRNFKKALKLIDTIYVLLLEII